MKPLRRRGLSLEQLEGRDLMALWDGLVGFGGPQGANPPGGNVTAEVVDGKLVIHGDAKDNGVTIYAFGGGKYAVDTVNSYSLINGRETVSSLSTWPREWTAPVFNNVTQGLDIDLGDGDGDDYVSIRGTVLGDVAIRTGAGDDVIHMDDNDTPPHQMATTMWLRVAGPAGISGSLYIDMGAGNDRTSIFANVMGDAIVQMGAGNDSFVETTVQNEVYSSTRYALVAGGELTIDLGEDEIPPPPPDDWHDDPDLADRIYSFIPAAFERYKADLAAGRVLPGEEWSLPVPNDSWVARIHGDGRMELEFFFYTGYDEYIKQLEDRGLQLDAYSLDNGLAFVQLREEDLRYFAFLPGLGELHLRSDFWNSRTIEWDYVRTEPLSDPIPEPVAPPAAASEPLFPNLQLAVLTTPVVYGPLPLGETNRRFSAEVPLALPDSNAADDENEMTEPTSLAPSTLSEETLTFLAAYYAEKPIGPKPFAARRPN